MSNTDTDSPSRHGSRAFFERLTEFTPEDRKTIVEAFSDRNLQETDAEKPRGALIEKIRQFGLNPIEFSEIPNIDGLLNTVGDIEPSHCQKPIIEQIRSVEQLQYAKVFLDVFEFLDADLIKALSNLNKFSFNPMLEAIRRDPSYIDTQPFMREREEYIRSALKAVRIVGSNENFGVDLDYAYSKDATSNMKRFLSYSRAIDHGNGEPSACKNIVADAIRNVYHRNGSILRRIKREKQSSLDLHDTQLWRNLERAIGSAHTNELAKSCCSYARSMEIARAAYEAAMVLAFAYGDDEIVQKWFATPNLNLRGFSLNAFVQARTPVQAFRAFEALPAMFRRPEEVVEVAIEDVACDLSGLPRNHKLERDRSSRKPRF